MEKQLLLPALRQYIHNDNSGFVGAYELAETEKIVSELLARIERLEACLIKQVFK